METTYKVQGMTCGGCARSVTEAIRRVQPDVAVDVDVDADQVRVSGSHDEGKVRQAVEDAGFDFGGKA